MLLPRLARRAGAVARSTSWWGRAFVRSFEELVLDERDLVAGRTLARSGRLGAIVVLPGMASAVVDGDLTPQVKVARLSDQAWADVEREVLGQAGHLAALESGRLPAELVEATDQLGIELVPDPGDLETGCGCDAWTQPCVHALALLYQLAWHLDRDPYVLMLLRGRTREQLVEAAARPTEPDPVGEAAQRAAHLLALVEEAPPGHGLADPAVAAYDEAVSDLLDEQAEA